MTARLSEGCCRGNRGPPAPLGAASPLAATESENRHGRCDKVCLVRAPNTKPSNRTAGPCCREPYARITLHRSRNVSWMAFRSKHARSPSGRSVGADAPRVSIEERIRDDAVQRHRRVSRSLPRNAGRAQSSTHRPHHERNQRAPRVPAQ